MELGEEEKKHRAEVRKTMARLRAYHARKNRDMFLEDLRRRAKQKNHLDENRFLKWCLSSCLKAGFIPNYVIIRTLFKQIGATPPSFTSAMIRLLSRHGEKRAFIAIWNEAMEKAKYEEIRQQEVQRIRDKTIRTKIRLEVEQELRKQIRKEFGIQEVAPDRMIPEEVKFEVWRRDSAKCVKCGSQRGLEFDHIIPFSKGGSNTARNVQLLCETCNRSKSDMI